MSALFRSIPRAIRAALNGDRYGAQAILLAGYLTARGADTGEAWR